MAALGVLALAACVGPAPTGSSATTGTAAPTADRPAGGCEYIGARFSPPAGFVADEHREAGVPFPRVSLRRDAASRGVLVSIIPRAAGAATATPKQQADEYFASLRNGQISRNWSNMSETPFTTGGRSHPSLTYRETMPSGVAGVDQVHDGRIVLFFPEDFPRGGYYYVFFWTDIHFTGQDPIVLTELEQLVSTFVVSGPPTTPSRGCAAR